MLSTATKRQRTVYPWSLWCDGKPRLARAGVDFFCEPDSFRNICYAYARNHGYRCHTTRMADGRVYFRIWDDPDAQ